MKARKALGVAFRVWRAASRFGGGRSPSPSFEAGERRSERLGTPNDNTSARKVALLTPVSELLKLKSDVSSLRAEVDSDRSSRLVFEGRIMANLFALEARIPVTSPPTPPPPRSLPEGMSILKQGQPPIFGAGGRPHAPPPPHILQALYSEPASADDAAARSEIFRRTGGVLFRWAGEKGAVCVNVDQEMARARHR